MTQENDVAVQIHGFEDVPRNHEPSLIKAVANQPTVVSIECNNDFQLYKEVPKNSQPNWFHFSIITMKMLIYNTII